MSILDHLRRWWPAGLAAVAVVVVGWLGFSVETRGQVEEVKLQADKGAEANTEKLTLVSFTSGRIQLFGKNLIFADAIDKALPGLLGTECAGTFISKKRFVTAAHCVEEGLKIPIDTLSPLGSVDVLCCRDSTWDTWQGTYCPGPGSQELGDWAICEIQGRWEVSSWESISTKANARGKDLQLVHIGKSPEDLGNASVADVDDVCFTKGGGVKGRSGSPVVVKDTGELLAIYSGFEGRRSHMSSMVPFEFNQLRSSTCRNIP